MKEMAQNHSVSCDLESTLSLWGWLNWSHARICTKYHHYDFVLMVFLSIWTKPSPSLWQFHFEECSKKLYPDYVWSFILMLLYLLASNFQLLSVCSCNRGSLWMTADTFLPHWHCVTNRVRWVFWLEGSGDGRKDVLAKRTEKMIWGNGGELLPLRHRRSLTAAPVDGAEILCMFHE